MQCEFADRCTNLRLPEIFMKLKISKIMFDNLYESLSNEKTSDFNDNKILIFTCTSTTTSSWPDLSNVKWLKAWKKSKRFIYGLYLQYPLKVCLSVVFIWYVPAVFVYRNVCLHNSSIVYLWSFSALAIQCLFTFEVCLHYPCIVCLAVEFVCIVPAVSVYL